MNDSSRGRYARPSEEGAKPSSTSESPENVRPEKPSALDPDVDGIWTFPESPFGVPESERTQHYERPPDHVLFSAGQSTLPPPPGTAAEWSNHEVTMAFVPSKELLDEVRRLAPGVLDGFPIAEAAVPTPVPVSDPVVVSHTIVISDPVPVPARAEPLSVSPEEVDLAAAEPTQSRLRRASEGAGLGTHGARRFSGKTALWLLAMCAFIGVLWVAANWPELRSLPWLRWRS